MASDDKIVLDGVVVDVGAGGHFKVQVAESHFVSAKLAGRLRMNKIRVVLGDKVKVAVSTYDPTRGIISFRDR